MKNTYRIAATTLTLTLFLLTDISAQSTLPRNSDGTYIIENFQEDQVGDLPRGWYNRDGSKKIREENSSEKKKYKYKVEEEKGNKFLRYSGSRAMHINFPLINKDKENIYNIDIYKTPVLSWKVRAHSLPKGGDEEDGDRNDVVASVYVVFDFGRIALFKKVPKSIRYTWSTTLDKGTETSKLFGNQQIVVLKSGKQDTGKWVTFERNLVDDYKRLFGDKPPKTPLAILILSDGDSTGSYVMADYDDFMLKPSF